MPAGVKAYSSLRDMGFSILVNNTQILLVHQDISMPYLARWNICPAKSYQFCVGNLVVILHTLGVKLDHFAAIPVGSILHLDME